MAPVLTCCHPSGGGLTQSCQDNSDLLSQSQLGLWELVNVDWTCISQNEVIMGDWVF